MILTLITEKSNRYFKVEYVWIELFFFVHDKIFHTEPRSVHIFYWMKKSVVYTCKYLSTKIQNIELTQEILQIKNVEIIMVLLFWCMVQRSTCCPRFSIFISSNEPKVVYLLSELSCFLLLFYKLNLTKLGPMNFYGKGILNCKYIKVETLFKNEIITKQWK